MIVLTSKQKKFFYCGCAILLIGAGGLLRFLLLIREPQIGRDETYYVQHIIMFLKAPSAEDFYHLQPPLLLFWGKYWLKFLGGSPIFSLQMMMLVWGTCFLIPWYFIGNLLFRQKNISLLLLAFAATSASFMPYGKLILREGPAFCFGAFYLWIFLSLMDRETYWKYIILGLLFGTGILVRYEFGEWAIWSCMVLCFGLRHKEQRIRRLIGLLLLFTCSILTVAGWQYVCGWDSWELVTRILKILWERLNLC